MHDNHRVFLVGFFRSTHQTSSLALLFIYFRDYSGRVEPEDVVQQAGCHHDSPKGLSVVWCETYFFNTITLIKLGQPLDPTHLCALQFFIASVHLNAEDAFIASREALPGSSTR